MDQLLSQGVELMMLGMGIVFSFLVLLVFVTTVMSTLVNRFFPESPEPSPSASQPSPGSAPAGDVSPRTLAIIQDAIRQHRARHR